MTKFELLKVEEGEKSIHFQLNDEDHTLGNALRSIIMKNEDVVFCGYSLPHPNERKIVMKIETNSASAFDALKHGLTDLINLCQIVKDFLE